MVSSDAQSSGIASFSQTFSLRIFSLIDSALSNIDSDAHFKRHYNDVEEEVGELPERMAKSSEGPCRRMSYIAAIQSKPLMTPRGAALSGSGADVSFSSRQGGRFTATIPAPVPSVSAPRLPLHLRQSNNGPTQDIKVHRHQENGRDDDTRISAGGGRDQGQGQGREGKGKNRR